MRQAVFAILLILAAFSGGALVNGPGLGWAQRHLVTLAEHLPGDFGSASADSDENGEPDDEDGVSIDDSPSSASPSDPGSNALRLPRNALPVAEASPFSEPIEQARSSESESFTLPDDLDQPVRAPRGPSIVTASASIPEGSGDSMSTPPRALPTPPPSLLDSARSRLSTDRSGTVLETTGNASLPGSSSSAPVVDQAVDRADDDGMTSPTPPNSSDPSIRLASTSGASGASAQEGAEWVVVHRQMVELGVGRFWVEGDFGGPVLFRCVVPVIGDRAVSQHFEAEGDDLLSAARLALKRIALWRATEDLP